MFKKVLLATDGSQAADRAADAALGLARSLEDAHITILHVSDDAPTRNALLKADLDIKSVLKDQAHKAIKSTEAKFDAAQIPFTLEVALGNPAAKVVEYAAAHEIDLIIIGNRGRGAVSAAFLGSVSQQVVHEARCPVMIVK